MSKNSQINQKLFSLKFIILLLLIIINIYPENTSQFDFKKAGEIIILDGGRKKPLDSYARKKLIQISGRKSIDGISAREWLLKLMFYPGAVDTMECFRITNPEVIEALGIQGTPKRRYRYTELYTILNKCEQIGNAASQKNPSNLMPYEREILQLCNNIQEYNEIGSTFSAFDPNIAFTVHDSSLAQSLNIEVSRPYSYSDFVVKSSELSINLKKIGENKLGQLTSADSELIQIVRTMYAMNSHIKNGPPYLIPVSINNTVDWYNPWGYICKSGLTAIQDDRMHALLDMKFAYNKGDAVGFNEAIAKLTSVKYNDVPFPNLEVLYNELNPFFWAKLLFAVAGVFVLCGMFYTRKWIGQSSFVLIGVGFLLQTIGLILRILIQMRPPLASLYETFVFVAWIIVMLGFVLEILQRRSTGLMIASFGGFLFLFISGRYTINGDTFGVLSAVLNSSFWLTTHIVTISIGYAGCLIAGLLGHVYLIQNAIKSNDKVLKSSDSAVYAFMLLGLAFTVAGTVLGGMWADQAWGRFWGWDPKENGALLIILWGSVVIHARKGRLIGPTLTSFGAIIGIIMVMLAWVGVNLLGIGLHSYGFTYSGLGLLAGISLFEIAFLTVAGILITKNRSEITS